MREQSKVGMTSAPADEVMLWYKKYAKRAVFSVKKRSSRPGDDGRLSYVTLASVRQGA